MIRVTAQKVDLHQTCSNDDDLTKSPQATGIFGITTSFINCPLCSNHFESPKVLACWHSFCLECLERIIPENSITLVCPSCFMPSILPKQGVSGLPDNWLLIPSSEGKAIGQLENNGDSYSNLSGGHSGAGLNTSSGIITRLVDPNDPARNALNGESNRMADSGYYDWAGKNSTDGISICDEKERLNPSCLTGHENDKQETASSSAAAVDDATTTTTSRSYIFSPRSFRSSPDFLNRTPCRVHPNKPLFSYCCQWELPLCRSCSLLEGHSKHKHLNLDLAVLRQKKELDSFVQTTGQMLETLNLNKSLLQRTKAELDKNYACAKLDALQSFDCLQKFFQERMHACLQEIDVLYEQKNATLEKQLKSLNSMFLGAQKNHDLIENVLESDKNEAILLASKVIRDSKRNTKISPTQVIENSRPSENSFLEFDKRNVAALIETCGELSFLVAEKQICVTLSKEDLQRPHTEGKQIKLGIHLVGEGQALIDNCKEKLSSSLYAEVFLPNGNRIIPIIAPDQVGSKLGELQFSIKEAGSCKVEVFCFGCPVLGSPFDINVLKPVSSVPARMRHPVEKRKSIPMVTRTSIPISIRSIESKLPVYKSTDTGCGRPPWNSSSHLSSILQRSSSSLTSRPSAKKKTSSKHQSLTDLTKTLQSDLSNSKFYGSMLAVKKKIELEAKIEEEPEFQSFADQFTKLDSNLNNRISRLTRLPLRSTSFRSNARPELPPLHKTSLKVEPAIVKRPICRTASLRYQPKKCHENASRCRVIGRKGSRLGEFLHVQGVSFRNETIFVTDSKTRSVQLIAYKSGIVVKRFDYQDSSTKTAASSPVGIAQDSQGLVYVSDFAKGCVFLFSEDGKLIRRIKHEYLAGPKGILLDDQGKLIVIDTKSCSVQTFCTQSGKLLKKFGSRGYSESEMCGPHFCALSPDKKRVIVSDFGNGKVKIFSTDGTFVNSFGTPGTREGHVKKPTGIATDTQTGHVVVADFELSCIQVFEESGQFVRVVDTTSSPISGPLGLCLTDDGHVVVADSGNHCLKIFNYSAPIAS